MQMIRKAALILALSTAASGAALAQAAPPPRQAWPALTVRR
jgi:hypothetical protein